MGFLAELWLPIVLSAVFVFIISAIFHMAIPIHKKDYRQLPGEDGILDAMRGLTPGQYFFPFGCMEDQSAEMTAKLERGPVGFMTVIPSGRPGMLKNLVLWFVYTVIVGVFVGYLGWHAAGGAAATSTAAFRFAGATAILAYAVPSLVDAIWKSVSWPITAKFIFEGVVYGLVTGATFAWLWPEAA